MTRPSKPGEEVAVMLRADSPASDTLEIATINYCGPVYIKLNDGRLFSTIGGVSLLNDVKRVIVPASDKHRVAISQNTRQSA